MTKQNVFMSVERMAQCLGPYTDSKGKIDFDDALCELLHLASSEGEEVEKLVNFGLQNWRNERAEAGL